MEEQRKIWLCEQYAQQVWSVSLAITQEAARAGEHGGGYAVIARETRALADKMLKYAELLRFEPHDGDKFKGIDDCAVMMSLLAINTELEAANMARVSIDYNIPKSMAVFADQLRVLSERFNELAGGPARDYVLPEAATPAVVPDENVFLRFSIGGVPLAEVASKIREVNHADKNRFAAGTYALRGETMPVIDCYERLGLRPPENDYRPVLIICPGQEGAVYAVPTDGLDVSGLFISRAGVSVPLQEGHAFAGFTRESWDAVGGGQLVFVDWVRFKSF